jgi:hypothetical protein
MNEWPRVSSSAIKVCKCAQTFAKVCTSSPPREDLQHELATFSRFARLALQVQVCLHFAGWLRTGHWLVHRYRHSWVARRFGDQAAVTNSLASRDAAGGKDMALLGSGVTDASTMMEADPTRGVKTLVRICRMLLRPSRPGISRATGPIRAFRGALGSEPTQRLGRA